MDTESVNKIMHAIKKTADEFGSLGEHLAKQNLLQAANVQWDIGNALLTMRRNIYLEFGGDERTVTGDL